ncbi:MAG: DNA polymerase I [Clostridia bacterium]|nr:DNA polymerase I [Clostridia bacterium]
MMGKALIFDGNSILNRAFYGVRPLSAPDGLPTNALFGFVGMINKAFSQIGGNPSYAAIAFDLKDKTFRHKACDTYKATRKPMPDDLALQLPVAHEIANALGIKVIEISGYEADDILGTLSYEFTKLGEHTFIVTGDRDSFQLINDNVTVLLTANDETKVTTPIEIKEKYGVEPKKLIDIKAIMGDSSDNISGVAGIGEKGAIKLITEYGSLDNVYENVDSIKGSVGKKLIEGKESAYMSRFLAEIKLDVPLNCELDDCVYNGIDVLKLRELYTRLGFRQFLEKLDASAPVVDNQDEEVFGIDKLPSLDGKTIYLNYDGNEISILLDKKTYKGDAKSGITKALECENVICWSSKEVLHLLKDNDLKFKTPPTDLSLLSYVCAPTDNGVTFGKTVLDLLGVSSSDVKVSLLPELYDKLKEKVTDELMWLYEEVELPLASLLCDMEHIGFKVDENALDSFGEQLNTAIAEEEEAIWSFAGEKFNINSTKQLGNILFDKLMLPHYRKTKSGYSTDVSVLEKLINYHPIIELILDYRKDSKLKNTYCDGLSKQISDDGRIHTTFKQTQTLTGRLSSAEPNLQNIPVRSEKGKELRKFFVADEGCILIDADYSQIELRVLAHVSGDQTLINAFINGEDIHTVTASQVFGVPIEAVTSEMRKRAKAVNFGIIYGIGDYSLSQDLKIPKKTAAEYIENYLAKYPQVRDYLDNAKKFARKNGYVETMFNRRRYIPEINSSNKNLSAFGERVAMNMPIQGAAADLIKIAMIRTDKMLKEAGLKARLILQIHDELIIESPIEEAQKAEAILREAMQGAAKLSVPLQVDIAKGKSWYDAKD